MSRRRKKAPADEPPLTFQWTVREPSLGRLIFFGTATLIAVAAFFFVFRVVYPESGGQPLVSRRIILLSSDDPATRPLVQRALDRSFALLPSPDPDGLTPSHANFEPSYAGYRMRLKPLTQSTSTGPALRLLTLGESVLPPLARIEPGTSVPAPPPGLQLVVRLSGPLADRLQGPAAWTDIPLRDTIKTRFRLGVKDDGRVVFALPMEPIDDPELQDLLLRHVGSLAFAPAAQPGIAWTQATFQWEEAPAP